MKRHLTLVGLVIALSGTVLGCATDTAETTAAERVGAAASALSAASSQHRVQLSTGVSLAYVEQGTAASGDAPFIFLHGYTDSHRSWDRVLPHLPRSIHAYALDQRGHGDSDKPACCYTQADFSSDVVAFMNALGIDRATLVGHSMGSVVAHKVAVEHPSRVDELVLVGSAPTVAGNAVAIELAGYVDTLTDPVDPEFVFAFQSSTAYQPLPPSFLDMVVGESLKVPATVWQQALDGMLAEDHAARLPEIQARTFLFWGDEDGFFSAADQAALDAAIPDSTLTVYPDVGHAPHWEVPQRFATDLVRVTLASGR